jgi:membrane carboxypeptidase/penicillin-binding protein
MPKDTSDFLDGAGDYGSVGFDPLKFSDYPPFPELIAIPSDTVPDKVRYTGAKIAELLREIALTPWQAAALLMKSFLVTTVMVLLILVFLFAREFPNKEALVNYEPNLMTHIYGQDGEILDEFAITRRIYVPIEQIPDTVQQAFISAEDKNFFAHSGFDLRAIAIAFYEAIRSGGQNTRGASTITQQLLKNVAFRGEQIVDRKIYEIVLAGRIERLLGKDKILEIYLNEIFLGQNAYGVGAAAQTYFNRP